MGQRFDDSLVEVPLKPAVQRELRVGYAKSVTSSNRSPPSRRHDSKCCAQNKQRHRGLGHSHIPFADVARSNVVIRSIIPCFAIRILAPCEDQDLLSAENSLVFVWLTWSQVVSPRHVDIGRLTDDAVADAAVRAALSGRDAIESEGGREALPEPGNHEASKRARRKVPGVSRLSLPTRAIHGVLV